MSSSLETAPEDWVKQRVVQAGTDDTLLTKVYDLTMKSAFPTDIGDRVIRNNYTAEWHGRDTEVVGASDELRAQVTAAVQAKDASLAPVRADSEILVIIPV